MAACCLGGAPNKLFGFYSEAKKIRYTGLVTSSKTTQSRLEHRYWLRGIQIRHEPVHAAGFDRQPYRFTNSFVVSCDSSFGTENDIGVDSHEEKSITDRIIPGSPEVQSLLTTICDTTSIAEFKLNLAGFRLYVKRSLVEKKVLPAPSFPIVQTDTSHQTPESNGSASMTSLAISKPKISSEGIQRILDTAPAEGLMILQSPKVGFFRRSRTIKGKKAPPSCKDDDHSRCVGWGHSIQFLPPLVRRNICGECIPVSTFAFRTLHFSPSRQAPDRLNVKTCTGASFFNSRHSRSREFLPHHL